MYWLYVLLQEYYEFLVLEEWYKPFSISSLQLFILISDNSQKNNSDPCLSASKGHVDKFSTAPRNLKTLQYTTLFQWSPLAFKSCAEQLACCILNTEGWSPRTSFPVWHICYRGHKKHIWNSGSKPSHHPLGKKTTINNTKLLLFVLLILNSYTCLNPITHHLLLLLSSFDTQPNSGPESTRFCSSNSEEGGSAHLIIIIYNLPKNQLQWDHKLYWWLVLWSLTAISGHNLLSVVSL